MIDKTGELPQGSLSRPVSRQNNINTTEASGNPFKNGTPPAVALPPSFPQYEVEDDVEPSAAPPPIKVTRAKKKGTTSGKKKRTHTVDSASPVVE